MIEEYTKIVKMETNEKYAEANRYLSENYMETQVGYEQRGLKIINRISDNSFTIKGEEQKKVNDLEDRLNKFNSNKK